MSTTGVGDAAASFSYEGGGAGGKFRKRPFRRTQQTTPYDRPVNSLRGITDTGTAAANDNNGSWLAKLVVDPASKLISYGANRFFSSVFLKRLPASPRQAPEAIHEMSGEFQVAVPENQSRGQEPAGGNGSHLINNSVSGGISEIEQLLKQKTFTRCRPEIEHLRVLLHSKAVEVPVSDDGKMTDALAKLPTDVESLQQYTSASLEKNKIEDRSHGVISTPIVLEDEIASPAELAKAYMGSRPLKLSPSMLGMRNQAVTEGSGLLSNVLITPKPPITSFTMKNAVNPEVLKYGSVTPRSRGRSAMYNMAHTPYSRVYPTDVLKGTGSVNNGYGGPSSSSSPFALEHYRRFGPNKLTLKRRSSILDDDLGSVGPIRRIRQKPSLLSHRSPISDRGVEIGSDASQISLKQKLPLEDETRHKVSKTIGENEDNGTPSTSYTPVPSKSSEIAARILQHLEKLTPKEKSSESKLAAVREKLPLKMKPVKLQDGHKLEGWPIATLPYAHDSTSQKQGEVEENGPKESVGPCVMLTPAVNIDTSVSVNTFRPMVETNDTALNTFASQPPQKRRSSEMSAHEEFLEQDNNRHSHGRALKSLDDRKGTAEIALIDGKTSPAELKSDKTTIQLELKSPLGPLSSKSSDMESSGVFIVGKESALFASKASQAPSTSFQSTLLPQSVFNFDKPKEVNNTTPSLSFTSKVDDRSPSFAISSSPSELSNRKPFTWSESKPESSSSSVNVLSPATGGQQIVVEPNKGGDQNTQKDGSTFGKYETVPSVASNGSFVSSPPAFSYTPSTSIANFMPSFTAASSSCHFGSNVSPSPVIKFGNSEDPPTAVSASSTSNASEPTVFQSKAESNSVFGSLSNISSSISSFVTSSGSNTFRLGSSPASSMANGQSQSLLGAASGFLTSSVGIVSQSTPIQSGTYASLSSFNISSSSTLGSSSFSSQALSPNSTTGFSSSLVPSSATNGIGSGNGPTSSLFKFVGSSSGVNLVSSSSSATGLSSFGLSSSSSETNTVGSSSGTSSGIFSFSGSSSAYTPGTNAASNSTSTSGIFKFGGNSSTSSMFSTSTSLTGFSFGASSSSFATNTAPMVLNLSSGASSSLEVFSYSAASSPVFGNPSSPFANNNQINTEDSMIEDSVQSPSLPVFGQPSASPSPPAVMFGLASTSQANPFQFGGQTNQVAQQNPSPFQASTSLEYNAGRGFSLGSGGGGDKSGHKMVKVNRNKHRKK